MKHKKKMAAKLENPSGENTLAHQRLFVVNSALCKLTFIININIIYYRKYHYSTIAYIHNDYSVSSKRHVDVVLYNYCNSIF